MQYQCPVRFDPLSPDQLEDPYPTYAALRDKSPVHYEPELDLWIVSRHSDVVTTALNTGDFSSEGSVQSTTQPYPAEVLSILDGGIGDMIWMTSSDDPDHRRVRSLVNKVFTPKRVRDMEPQIERYVHTLINGFVEEGETDIIESFAWPLPLWGLAEILGVPREHLGKLHQWSYEWLRLMQLTDPISDLVGYAHSFVELQHYVLAALEDRQAHPRDDLMTALLESSREVDPPLRLNQLAWVPMNLIIAGHVTVTRAIGSGLATLLGRPEELSKLQGADEHAMTAAVEEILRYESPAQGLFRTVRRDVEIDGVMIPEGSKVMLHFGSANRDPKVFTEPEKFRPDRDDVRHHVAFGKGVHFCVGAPLARAELKHSFRGLLDRLPNLRRVGSGERDTIFFARGWSSLPLTWDVGR